MTASYLKISTNVLAFVMLATAVTALFAGTTESTGPGGSDSWTGSGKTLAPPPNWAETFDSYVSGSQLHGLGGWKGWNNDPAFGALANDTQAHSIPNSVDVMGSTDLVHEFSGFDSGIWIFTAWQFIPIGTTGTPYFIMLNQYNEGVAYNWSVQVQFDTSTGMVINTGVSIGNPISFRRNEWVEIRIVINLDSDTQTFYYGGQELYTGTWSGQVSGGGIAAIGAVSLAAIGSSSVFYDDFSLTNNLLFMDSFESGKN